MKTGKNTAGSNNGACSTLDQNTGDIAKYCTIYL